MNTASPMPDEAIPGIDDLNDFTMHEPMSRIMQDERAIAIAKAHGANVIFNGEVAMSARELANTLRQVEREAIERALALVETHGEMLLSKYVRARLLGASTDEPGQARAKCACAEGTSHTVCTSFKEDKYRPGYCGNPDPSDTPSGRIRNICGHLKTCHADQQDRRTGEDMTTIQISAVHLRKEADKVIVAVEVDGKWVDIIKEHASAPFSHICEAGGINARIVAHHTPTTNGDK